MRQKSRLCASLPMRMRPSPSGPCHALATRSACAVVLSVMPMPLILFSAHAVAAHVVPGHVAHAGHVAHVVHAAHSHGAGLGDADGELALAALLELESEREA